MNITPCAITQSSPISTSSHTNECDWILDAGADYDASLDLHKRTDEDTIAERASVHVRRLHNRHACACTSHRRCPHRV